MNRLFEALGEMEVGQPAPNGAVAQPVVIQLGARTVDEDSSIYTQVEGTEQTFPEANLQDLSPFDASPPLVVQETEPAQIPVEDVSPEVSPFDVLPPMSMPATEPVQLSVEDVLAQLSPFDEAPPMFAPEAEPTQLSVEDVPRQASPFDASTSMFVPETEPQLFSMEDVPEDESPFDETQLLSLPEAEPGPLSLGGAGSDGPSFDLVPPMPTEEVERVTLSPKDFPQNLSPFDITALHIADAHASSSPTQDAAKEKNSQPTPADVTAASRVHVKVSSESRLVALTNPDGLGAEKFRALVTRLEHLHKECELKSFQVTSSVVNEGKTLVSANVAMTLAKHSGVKTLLIEGDLHRPTLATIFGLNKIRGLRHWWTGRDQELTQFVHRLDDMPLWFLSAGGPCDRPSDILRSVRFGDAFARLASQFEWIVVDSTPMLPIVDVNLWSRLVDGTILVVREGVTPIKALKQGLGALDHPNLVGVVMNDASVAAEAKYDSEYYGSSKRKKGG